MQIITLNKITKDYHLGKTVIHALRNIDLAVAEGEFTAVMGPSGCGKSTLLNMIGCIDSPTSGSVFINGIDSGELTDNARADLRLGKIGFIFQSFNLVPVLTIFENVEFPLILARIPKNKRRERVEHLLDLLGIKEYSEHRPDELSGGQRQRVAIARALVNSPAIVIADEPTANLDSDNSAVVLEAMRRMNREEKVTIIFSTHNPDILVYARRILTLRDGLIVSDKENRP